MPSAITNYYNLTISSTGQTANLGVSTTINGNLAVSSGTLSIGAFTIAVTGTTTVDGTLTITSTTGTKTFTGNVTVNSGGTLSETVNELITYGGNVTVNSGGTLVEFGNATMSVAGNFQNDGTYTAATGAHTFSGTGKTFSGTISIPSLTLSGTYTNNGTLTVSSVLGGSGTLTQGTDATLNIADAAIAPTLVATASGNTVNWNDAGSQTIKSTTGYYNLTTSGSGTKSSGAATTVAGTLTIGSGTTLDITTGNDAWSVAGDWTNNGSFTARSGTITLNGAGAQAIGGSAGTTFNNMTLAGSGAKTTTGATVNGILSLEGTATTTGSAPTYGAAATLQYKGSSAQTTGTEFTSPWAGTGGVTINNASGVILGAVKTIDTTLTLTAGTFTLTNALTMATGSTISRGNGSLSTAPTFAGTVNVTYTGATAGVTTGSELPTSTGNVLNNLTINNSGQTITLGAAVTVNGDLTITAGTLNTSAVSNYGVTLKGSLANSGTFTANASAITIGGTGTQSIAGFTTTGGVTVTKTGGTATLQSAMSPGALTMNGVGGTLNLGSGLTHTVTNVTLTNGTLDGGSSTLNVTGTWTGTSGFTASMGTVGYTGSSQAIGAVTYNSLTINQSSGNATLGGAATVNGTLTLSAGNLAVTDPQVLTMGSSATTAGSKDVTGIVKRTSMVASTAYTFGSQYTTVTFAGGGTIPTDFSIKISIGSATSWKTGAVQRIYDILRTAGSGTMHIAPHYLDTELNGNTETRLVIWAGHLPTPPGDIDEHGRSNYDTTNNWVTLSALSVTYIATAYDTKQWAVANSALTPFTWTGATNTNWGYATNWSPAGVPSDQSDVVIPDAATTANDPTLPASATISRMTIESGGILNAPASGTLTIGGASGAWSNNGTFNASTSTVVFTNAAATASGTTDFYNVTINASAGLEVETNATMRIGGTMTNNGTWDVTMMSGTTVEYNGGSQTVLVPNGLTSGYRNLTLSGSGTKTMPGTALSIGANFSMSGTASATAGAAINTTGSFTVGSGTSFTTGAYTHTIGGDFSNSGTFTATGSTITLNGTGAQAIGGSTTTAFNNLTISNTSAAVSANTNFSAGGTLTVNASAVLNPAAAVVISGAGTLTGSGTVNVTRTAATADLSSQHTISTKTLTNLTAAYTGSAAQTVSALTYGGLKINNASGVTLGGNATVGGTLTLTSGNITTGSNSLIIASGGSVSRTSGHVVGNLQKAVTGTGTISFEVGTGSDYAPISANITAVTGTGTLTGSSSSGVHGSISSSGISSNKYVNRYWSLTSTGITSPTYNATFTFVNGDLVGSPTTSSFIVRKYSSGTWTRPPGGTSTTGNATTGSSFTAFSDYAIGEPPAWASYESDYSTPKDTYYGASPTVYMRGTGFPDVSYLVAYYDASGAKRGTQTVSASGGTLSSSYDPYSQGGASAGIWRVMVQPSSGYTGFGEDSYATIVASPDTYGLFANDSFTYDLEDIPPVPELSTIMLMGLGMAGLGVWFWLTRRRTVAES